ncbi:Asp23/Gls24 family envelope stress response protein [Corynebacterium pacaense]|uniref:Asp23/Gls24 family envelope stress response protein n=1 Tax=Corynebacterium pacaense TaxID=1816684 RepID=UPI0009BAABEA|nr:Asp23/Gls24 family envelope stress response protein [Corynebacterium pacaense]
MEAPRRPGRIRISERAVNRIVAAATASVPGVVGMSRGSSRIAGRSYPRCDVQIDEDGRTASIEAFIAVSWPAPVTDVAVAVRTAVIDWVGAMTGITALRVNVVVGPVVPSDTRVTRALIDARPRLPRLRRLTVIEAGPSIPVDTAPSRDLTPIVVHPHPVRSITAPPPPRLRPIVTVPGRVV